LSTASKAKGLLWVLGAVAFAAAAAWSLPDLARQVPWPVERWLGGIAGAVPDAHLCRGRPAASALLERLVRRIDPVLPGDEAIPVTVEVVRGKTVNAYATLGGRIYVFEGLLAQARSPEELAGVLAHEIEHVRNRHIIQGLAVNLATLEALRVIVPGGEAVRSRLAYTLLSLQFSRQQEAQADELGLARLRAAQVDAAGLEQFFARAGRLAEAPPFLSNHPSSELRRALAAQARGYPTRPVLAPEEWVTLGEICR
jgi:predicted Zn-dependent protease